MTGLRAIAISPDQRRIAVGDDIGNPRKVKIFDWETEQEVIALTGPTDSIADLAFWPDGRTLVAVSASDVFVWRAVREPAVRPTLAPK